MLVHGVLAPGTALHAMLYKRDSRAAFGWIAVCVILPLLGPVLYLLFGINRVRTRAAHIRSPSFTPGYERGDAHLQRHPLPPSLEPEYEPLARVGAGLSRHPLLAGNTVLPLHDGEGAYPQMLDAIDNARERVLLNSYIFDSDSSGRRFVDAFAAAAARGVEVRVLVDGLGEFYSRPRISRLLRRSDVTCARFLPLRVFPPSLHVNLRSHHKLLICDNTVGFTGGMNIGDRHLVQSADGHRVRDMHFSFRGPLVAQLEQTFIDSWHFASGERLSPGPPPTEAGAVRCRVITDGPDEDLDRLTMLLVSAISLARDRILIMTPYFLPPREIIAALQAAAVRGVEVVIVLPEENNLPFVHWATRNMLWEVLMRGVRVIYQPPPFAHTKLFVVDDAYTLVGSANWDARSLRLNFELVVEIYGQDFAAAMATHVMAAVEAGRPVDLQQLDSRALPARLRDSICWLFTPYL